MYIEDMSHSDYLEPNNLQLNTLLILRITKNTDVEYLKSYSSISPMKNDHREHYF